VTRPARTALFAWSYALKTLGRPVPDWQIAPAPAPVRPLIAEYASYRKRYRGVAASTLIRDTSTAEEFLAALRSAGRSIARVRVSDIDGFVTQLALRMCPRSVADTCSSLRAFLRFLHARGRLHHDLAAVVAAPRVRRVDHPPEGLAWSDVRRLLRSAQGESASARRGYAVLLLMATYGLGAAEVVALRLEDVDWAVAVLKVRRPKTGATIALPLLPAVARTIATYLRRGRPRQATTRALFVSSQLPHGAMSTSAVRFLVRQHARAAGISVPVSGHMLRHSHATRQIDAGANPKVVGDILGHRRTASTSIYIRVAWRRLRGVGLPVPA
jgi:site-specific recombinase XerD